MEIRQAQIEEFDEVRTFYHTLIDEMRDAEYQPGWEKEIYPSDAELREALEAGWLYTGREDGGIAAAMIVNHRGNDGYRQAQWPTPAGDGETAVIHVLGVMPRCSGRGLGGEMVRYAIGLARRQGKKVVRLDVLNGNLPAERLYTGAGFQYVQTVSMFYEDTGWTDFLLYEYPL